MANSIKEYTAGVNPDGSTYLIDTSTNFTAPPHLEGRAEDIRVYVNGILYNSNRYTLTGTSLTFNNTADLPNQGHKVRIERSSSPDARLTNYVTGSILDASTLDNEANQLFFLSQEALDLSKETTVNSTSFYNTGDNPPASPFAGSLWFDTRTDKNVLMVYNGDGWVHTAPVFTEHQYTISSASFFIQGTDAVNGDYAFWQVPSITQEDTVYVNGVRLSGEVFTGTSTPNWLANNLDKDYYVSTDLLSATQIEEGLRTIGFRGSFTSSDIIYIVRHRGGYAETVTEAEANIIQLEASTQLAKDAANDSQVLAAKYADNAVDVTFDVGGVATYSAKHYATKANEDKTTVDGLVNGFAGTVSAATSTITNTEGLALQAVQTQEASSLSALTTQESSSSAVLQTIANSVDSVAEIEAAEASALSTLNALGDTTENFANHPIDSTFINQGTAYYSAKHYASKAADAANASVDKLNGWAVLDNETITTNGTIDPEIISSTNFSIEAPEGVKVNNIPLPFVYGYIDLSNVGWTGEGAVSFSTSSNSHTLTFSASAPTISSTNDFQCFSSYIGTDLGIVKTVQTATGTTFSVVDASTGNTPVTNGILAVKIYKYS